ncbi:MAG: Smr/MutS family protein [Deltaproteobacteria bacterium]|jgi:DNA-nicking Smr family endonuclease|nr:Smr/MutS family protein [Deltaproteobacteria bacterium]
MTEEKNFSYRPFDGLEKLVRIKRPVSSASSHSSAGNHGPMKFGAVERQGAGNAVATLQMKTASVELSAESGEEDVLFLNAMREVTPLNGEKAPLHTEAALPDLNVKNAQNEQKLVMGQLKAIVSGSAEVPVSATPEFVEGIGWGADRLLVQRLHKGEFSVQAYCDLHGMDLLSAMERCEEFLKEAIHTFKGCVAIIHGRGLSSRGRPVIKETVIHWLHSGPFRRYIIAFSSAPSWDGGAGVTYVLLRQRPAKRTNQKTGQNKIRG